LLVACQTAAAPPVTAELSDKQAFAMARQAVLATLKDPDSAKFPGIMTRRSGMDSFGTPEDIVCGTVNAKNSFGGYTGPRIFAFRMVKQIVTIDGDSGFAAGSSWCT